MLPDADMPSPNAKKRIVVLGSTGSIGKQVLDVAEQHADKIDVIGLAVYSNIDALMQQAQHFRATHLAVGDARLCDDIRCNEAASFVQEKGGFFGVGSEAVCALAHSDEADIIVNAIVGEAGLQASYETLLVGKTLALANKESLVVGGDLLMPLARRPHETEGGQCALMPIDSEHGAIYQCLLGENPDEVTRLWITSSGGPFRGYTRAQLETVTPEQALAHPTWNMGAKISVDSSTLMNKGLEVIEAHHLFDMPYDRIEVIVQPQSVVHSMVEFCDGSIKAHLGTTDMRIPIQFALSYPERWNCPVEPLDFFSLAAIDFEKPDTETFRCLDLARIAGSIGKTLPAVMNAANEVAVHAFLRGQLAFLDIAECVEQTMSLHSPQEVESIDQLEDVDCWARSVALRWIAKNSN